MAAAAAVPLQSERAQQPRISGGRAPAHRRWPHRRRPLTSKGSGCRAQRRRPNARKAVVTARTGGGCGQRRHHPQGGGLPRPLAAAAGRGGVAPASGRGRWPHGARRQRPPVEAVAACAGAAA
ncbi:hypothetical protein GW17_00004269 [Ensete ventricosum]|nr:hypothetical protein GW17_00004269 [Ensete ventricosum]RZS01283.1 hypothetical protein BHM03_00031119 [Ensete ventricosum]